MKRLLVLELIGAFGSGGLPFAGDVLVELLRSRWLEAYDYASGMQQEQTSL